MKYEIVELTSKKIVGLSTKTTNEGGASGAVIGAMWGQFIGQEIYEQIKNKANGGAIGLYTDYEGDATQPYRFMCCAEVTDYDNPDLEQGEIPKGTYAKFTVKGHMVDAVMAAWTAIWSMPLKRTYDCDFEYYHNDSPDMNQQTIDIYVSVAIDR
ncbi:MAG: GyrI-like domain-containing protein [Clostridia bacterium]|nr:GyrI-like domain-containing protein [Clostridia bacterium]